MNRYEEMAAEMLMRFERVARDCSDSEEDFLRFYEELVYRAKRSSKSHICVRKILAKELTRIDIRECKLNGVNIHAAGRS